MVVLMACPPKERYIKAAMTATPTAGAAEAATVCLLEKRAVECSDGSSSSNGIDPAHKNRNLEKLRVTNASSSSLLVVVGRQCSASSSNNNNTTGG
jgi:hypothetical protein